MTSHIKVRIKAVPDSYDLSHWRHVVAIAANGAYWPVAIAQSAGRAEIFRKALQAYADADPDSLVDEIFEAMNTDSRETP